MNIKQILSALCLALLLNSCNDYGKKVSSGPIDVYYKDGISETDAKNIARVIADIDRTQNNNSKDTKSFQLLKKNDTVCFRMVTNKESAATADASMFQALANIVSDSAFNGAPVNVELTDNKFVTVKAIPYKKLVEGAPAQ